MTSSRSQPFCIARTPAWQRRDSCTRRPIRMSTKLGVGVTVQSATFAVLDATPVGTIHVVPLQRRAPWSAWYDQAGVAMLGQFGVEPNLQGQGLGSRLLSFGEARAWELGAREVSIDTAVEVTRLVKFYGANGYREVMTTQW